MSGRPELWIVAGPNGAGKTTCVQTVPIRDILPRVRFLNPDDLTKLLLLAAGYAGFADAPPDVQRRCFGLAATRVEEELLEAVARGESVGIETVLSTDKYRTVVEQVHAAGGRVHLIYVSVATPEISARRVALRVARGGHGVPADKIAERFVRSHANLTWLAANADTFWVLDNSGEDSTTPPILCATGSNGQIDSFDSTAHPVLAAALSALPRRAG